MDNKLIEKINKEKTKLDALILKRNEYTAAYQKKLSEHNSAIALQQKAIETLKEQEKIKKLEFVANMAEKSGLTIDDLLVAISNNDFYGIQEKIESNKE